MKIGIDIDDVFADFMNPLLNFYNRSRNKNITYNQMFSYDFEKVWNCPKNEAIQVVREFYQTEEFDNLNLFEDSQEAYTKISKYNKPTFITSRFELAIQKTPF